MQRGCHVRSGAGERIDAAIAAAQPRSGKCPASACTRQGDRQRLGCASIGVRHDDGREGVERAFRDRVLIRGGARDARRDRRIGVDHRGRLIADRRLVGRAFVGEREGRRPA